MTILYMYTYIYIYAADACEIKGGKQYHNNCTTVDVETLGFKPTAIYHGHSYLFSSCVG